MSNKSRLQTNNTNLQELINKAENLPDAGGSGGSIETCTVYLTGLAGEELNQYNGDVNYMALQDGKPVQKYLSVWGSDCTLYNVLSDSFIFLGYSSEEASFEVSFSNGFAEVGMWNGVGILSLYDCTGEVEVRIYA